MKIKTNQDEVEDNEWTTTGRQGLFAGTIYHGCHKGTQLRFVVQDADLVDVVVVSSIGGREDCYLLFLPPVSTFLYRVQGSPGLWAGQP